MSKMMLNIKTPLKFQKLNLMILLLFFVSTISLSLTTQAQTEKQGIQEVTASKGPAPSNKVKDRKAILNFEDEFIEGTTQKPDLFYLFQKKNFNYKRLIKLRENFLPEMRKTTEDIQRVRSAN